MVQVYCKNTKESKRFPEGTSLVQMLSEFGCQSPYPIVSAKVNNVSQGLKFKVYQNKDIEFIDVREPSGMRVYSRSLFFLLYKAANDVFPGSKLYIEHPISNGYFCHLRKSDGSDITPDDLTLLETRMKELVAKDLPFHRYDVQTERAIREFRKAGFEDKVRLLETSGEAYPTITPSEKRPTISTASSFPPPVTSPSGASFPFTTASCFRFPPTTIPPAWLLSSTSPRPSTCSRKHSAGTSSWA